VTLGALAHHHFAAAAHEDQRRRVARARGFGLCAVGRIERLFVRIELELVGHAPS
jgi:hypothetical protein